MTSHVTKNLEGDLPPETQVTVGDSVNPEISNKVHKPKGKQGRVQRRLCTKCRKCDIVFATHSQFNRHCVQKHHKRKCQKCDMVFNGLCDFTLHVRKEHPGLPVAKVFHFLHNTRIKKVIKECVYCYTV